tara:strand:- start:1318 stop:1779 length:462 start_codon:yes stop_codon:yes gene_type:complete
MKINAKDVDLLDPFSGAAYLMEIYPELWNRLLTAFVSQVIRLHMDEPKKCEDCGEIHLAGEAWMRVASAERQVTFTPADALDKVMAGKNVTGEREEVYKHLIEQYRHTRKGLENIYKRTKVMSVEQKAKVSEEFPDSLILFMENMNWGLAFDE